MRIFTLALFILFNVTLSAQNPVDLPITFEDTATVDYALVDFGGNASMIIVDPDDPNNLVAQSIKTVNAELWAGTTFGGNGLANAIPFASNATVMTVNVWSPDAGIPVRLKAENASDPGISVETEATTLVGGSWSTLTFDFSNHVENTAALNLANTYDKVSIFFNFGTTGMEAGEKTYYADDVIHVEGEGEPKDQVNLPITFEDTAMVDYALVDFGGNASIIMQDPDDVNNLVAQVTKTDVAELWAGTTLGGSGIVDPIPFTMNSTKMTVRVWSPDADIPIRLKVEDAGDPTKSVETEALVTEAGAWNMLTFDFSNEVENTAELNLGYTYNKISLFFNFGTTGMEAGEKTYYADDVYFVDEGGNDKDQVNLPITMEDTATVDYALVDFGGNASMIVEDPDNSDNLVAQVIKTDIAELWAGTTFGGNGLVDPIPFAEGATSMTVRIWSPDAGIPIRLKVEDAADPGISVETETMTTVAVEWDTLIFDLSNEVENTAAINLANTYDKISIFFNFGTTGMEAGEKTYYADDIYFLEEGGNIKDQVNLPITLEDTATVDYALVDFGGNASMIVEDPDNSDNLVAQVIKTDIAELWAGTTFGENGLVDPIPFAEGATSMTVRIWSPDADIPIRLKVEDAADPGISVETETMTTVAGEWDTLIFDLSNEVENTAAINLANTYDKISIFFNFGTTGMEAGEKTYYADDIYFVEGDGNEKEQVSLPITLEDTATVDYALADFGGNASMIVEDPENSDNLVAQVIKTDVAELWAGTTFGANGLASAIPFTVDETIMTVRIWSPDADIPIRLKVEDATDPTKSVETEAMITVAGAWNTLKFDFSNEVENTAELNLDYTYDKASLFFNFGTTGMEAGEKTYYADDIYFGDVNVSTTEVSNAQLWIISPNPTNDMITIRSENSEDLIHNVEFYSSMGNLQHRELNVANNSTISIGGLASGTYFVKINGSLGSQIQKLILLD